MTDHLEAVRARYDAFKKHRQAFDPGAKTWYRMDTAGDAAEVFIYDAIGFFGVEAQAMIDDLARLKTDRITLRINSPGGNVFDGTAIYNALLRHPAKVDVKIDGLAASMASVIALAGDTVEMAEGAFYMIHNPWSLVVGDAGDLRKEAEVLDKLTESAVNIYANNSNLSPEAVRAAMDAETWYTAEEAKDAGFIDTVFTGSKPEALFDLSVFANAPGGLSTPREPEPDLRGLETLLRDAGMSRRESKRIASQYAKQRDAATCRQRDAEGLAHVADKIRENLSLLRHEVTI